MFEEMVDNIREETVRMLYHIHAKSRVEQKERKDMKANDGEAPAPVKADKKIGRNSPCPCGSGKKYKNCCGRNQE